MTLARRLAFWIGIPLTLVHLYLNMRLGSAGYDRLAEDQWVGFSLVVSAVFFLYYLCFTLACIVGLLTKRRKFVFPWLVVVVAIPLIGPYWYFEKVILRDKPRSAGKSKVDSESLVGADIVRRALPRRAAASVVDYGLFVTLAFSYVWALGTSIQPGTRVLSGSGHALLLLAGWFVYFPLCEMVWGKTLGKSLFHVKVVMYDGTKVTPVAALKRHILDPIDLVVFSLIAVTFQSHSTPRRLGDLWSQTVVVRDR